MLVYLTGGGLMPLKPISYSEIRCFIASKIAILQCNLVQATCMSMLQTLTCKLLGLNCNCFEKSLSKSYNVCQKHVQILEKIANVIQFFEGILVAPSNLHINIATYCIAILQSCSQQNTGFHCKKSPVACSCFMCHS